MLIKERDNRDADILELRRLLEYPITAKQRFLIEREIKCIDSGARGEESSAYFIDFRWRDSKNTAIIHDLRLEYRGFVAQIDHLLINRLLDVYVLESKNYYYGVKITPEEEFLVWNGNTYHAIESPIEQNQRHIDLLGRIFQQPGFMPTRLGVPIPANFLSYVMVAPNSRVDRPTKEKFDTSMVIKADGLGAAIDKRIDDTSAVVAISSLTKLVSQETLESFARRLVRLHRPAKFDFAAKFGVTVPDTPDKASQPVVGVADVGADGTVAKGETACEACGSSVDGKVAYYCRINKRKFGGKILCRSCQQKPEAPATTSTVSVALAPEGNHIVGSSEKKGTCGRCGAAVDGKVVYFCRINKEKFAGKVLCRPCQQVGGPPVS
ncbi:MAG: nuclease-related domain-containing protein [Thermodesulfobacteriota bacterium]